MSETDETLRPKYRISIVSEKLGIHPQTIRTYEKLDLIQPARSRGNTRLFSDRDLRILSKIQTLTQELGVNLAGVEVILRMLQQIEEMNREANDLIAVIRKLWEENDGSKHGELDELLKGFRWLKPRKTEQTG